MKLQISKKVPNNEGFAVITDVETDGQHCWEEIINHERAHRFVQYWNKHDKLQVKAKLLDELVTVLEEIKSESYPGLAISEGTLLNRIYRRACSILTKAKEVQK